MNREIENLSKEELLKLISVYGKNWLAIDGVWFQSAEKKYGMDEAMELDKDAWNIYATAEAASLKKYLGLPMQAGIEGLKKALSFRIYACVNAHEITIDGNTLTLRVLDCRVQTARKRKNMGFHPCKPAGVIEYRNFSKTIDDRFTCECISCYPDVTDDTCSCAWKFTLYE